MSWVASERAFKILKSKFSEETAKAIVEVIHLYRTESLVFLDECHISEIALHTLKKHFPEEAAQALVEAIEIYFGKGEVSSSEA